MVRVVEPPKQRPQRPRNPLLTGVWRMIFTQEVIARWIALALLLGVTGQLLSESLLSPMQGMAEAIKIVFAALGVAAAGVWMAMAGPLFVAIVGESSAGNDELYEPPKFLAFDWFGAGTPGNVRYARDFASGRRVRRAKAEMNRLYVAEPTPTVTGSIADSRQPLKASQVDAVARAILAGVQGSDGGPEPDSPGDAVEHDVALAGGRLDGGLLPQPRVRRGELGHLRVEQLAVRASGRQPDHPEPVGVGTDHVEGLGADGSGRPEDHHVTTGSHGVNPLSRR